MERTVEYAEGEVVDGPGPITLHFEEQPEPEEVGPWYPMWAPWLLWIVVVAALVMALAEWPKRLWFKPAPGEPPTTGLQKMWKAARGEKAKIGLLAPLLALLGAGIGGPAYHAAGLMESWFLCLLLGAGTGILSAPIYDHVVLPLLDLPAKLLGKGAAAAAPEPEPEIADTQDVPAVEPPEGFGGGPLD